LRLTPDNDGDLESGIALTKNGLYEKVTQRTGLINHDLDLTDELLADIPGGIGGLTEDDDEEDDTLLPKTGRDMGSVHGGMGNL